MNKSEDPNAPKNQEISHAPHEGRNLRGDIVADATESAGQDSAWETTAPLDPDGETQKAETKKSADEGYSSGPDTFATRN